SRSAAARAGGRGQGGGCSCLTTLAWLRAYKPEPAAIAAQAERRRPLEAHLVAGGLHGAAPGLGVPCTHHRRELRRAVGHKERVVEATPDIEQVGMLIVLEALEAESRPVEVGLALLGERGEGLKRVGGAVEQRLCPGPYVGLERGNEGAPQQVTGLVRRHHLREHLVGREEERHELQMARALRIDDQLGLCRRDGLAPRGDLLYELRDLWCGVGGFQL